MTTRELVLNSETATGQEPREDIDVALRKAMADLQAGFFDLERGTINYAAMQGTPQFDAYVRMAGFLKKFDPKRLGPRGQRLAFWINLYNTMVVHGVVALGIRESVKEKSRFFDLVTYDIGGYLFSLNDIEHGILRGNKRVPHRLWRAFGRDDPRNEFVVSPADPRVHFALVCGSQSCPPIAFYSSDAIEAQLDLAAKSFVNSGEVELVPEKRCLEVSRIFKWYRADFGSRDDVVKLIVGYLDEGPKKDFLMANARRIRIRYRPYDWSLNH